MSGNNNVSHASTVVAVCPGERPDEFKAMAFLYTESRNGRVPHSATKFPTESQEKGESRWMTACAGVKNELFKDQENPERFEFKSLDCMGPNGEPEPFLVCRVPSDPGKGCKWHDKCVFLISLEPSAVANLRTEEKWDGPTELLGVPEFVEASELWRRMLERGQPFHRAVLYKVIERFALRNQRAYERYRSILEDPRSKEAMVSRGAPIRFNDGN